MERVSKILFNARYHVRLVYISDYRNDKSWEIEYVVFENLPTSSKPTTKSTTTTTEIEESTEKPDSQESTETEKPEESETNTTTPKPDFGEITYTLAPGTLLIFLNETFE